jgi:glycosyltransferase involved in cell wall biosynthesis
MSLFAFLLRCGRRFDVIHVHQYGLPAALCVLAGFVVRRPVVLKLSSTGPQGIASRMSAGVLARPLRWLHRRLNRCIATSDRAAAEAVDFGLPEERVVRIANGIDTSVFRPAEASERQSLRERLGFRASRIALYVGRLSEEKDPLMLIEAWSRIGWVTGEAQLMILGDGPQRAEVEARITNLGLGESVMICGAVDDPLPFYRAADVLVLPSRNEGLSNSVVEALSTGLPLATTRVSGCEDIIAASGAGEMVEVGDTQAFATAIQLILSNDELRARQSEAARRYAIETFSIGQVADSTERLYSDLVGRMPS